MLRPYLFLVVLLLLPTGCKDKPAQKPSAIAPQTAPRMSPEMQEAQADKLDAALKQAGISAERSAALRAEMEKQAPRSGFTLSEDKQFIQGLPQGGIEGMPVTSVILEIEMIKPVPENAGEAVKGYFERAQQAVADQKKKEAELLATMERVDRGEVVGLLAPANDPIGDWQSLGETREGEKHFLVEHDDAYYKVLMLTQSDKRMTYHEFREGKLERNLVQPYEYDAEKGQLTSSGPGGGPPDAFYLMQLPNLPDRLFVRPMHETVFMFTVYKRVGNADRAQGHAEGARPATPPTGGR